MKLSEDVRKRVKQCSNDHFKIIGQLLLLLVPPVFNVYLHGDAMIHT